MLYRGAAARAGRRAPSRSGSTGRATNGSRFHTPTRLPGRVAHQHDHHDHEHDHGVAFERTDVTDETLKMLDAAHPVLSEILSLTRKYADLTDAEREDLARLHAQMEDEGPFLVGFHDEADRCAVCEEPVPALFVDRAGGGEIPFGPFASDLPAHVACMGRFPEKFPRMSPRVLDQARRKLMTDLDRPTAKLACFFRHDLLKHREFSLTDWGGAVFEANEGAMSRQLAKDVEKCVSWVHHRLHH